MALEVSNGPAPRNFRFDSPPKYSLNVIVNGFQELSLKAVQDSGEGSLAWSFRNMGGTSEINQLSNSDGTLTNYGKEVAAYIAE